MVLIIVLTLVSYEFKMCSDGDTISLKAATDMEYAIKCHESESASSSAYSSTAARYFHPTLTLILTLILTQRGSAVYPNPKSNCYSPSPYPIQPPQNKISKPLLPLMLAIFRKMRLVASGGRY